VQYILDFSFLKAEMEKGGLVVQSVKCPSCSAAIALPQTGSTTKCEYCGATVFAQDVFDRIKGLMKQT
jgi:DNA-directed RNA polymerase subunit RPC12/RpoP